jgi:hypothetical protein
MAHKTNWEHLVGYHHCHYPECEPIYTCVFCGDMQAPNKRFTDISFMHKAIYAKTNIFTDTTMHRTYINIYNSIKFYANQKNDISSTEDESSPQNTDHFSICMCINCYYWTSRHKNNNLIPTMYLKWYMNTLHSGSCKCFDKRVLYRIACTLLQTQKGFTNFYLTMFSAAEIESIRILASNGLKNVTTELNDFYVSQMGDSLFFDHKLAAKCVRDKRQKEAHQISKSCMTQ